jgi:AcrB/AcrD/AcrF family
MWIVKLALNRPYTFVVLALLIFVLSPLVILRTPTDIFPNIDIPVISAAWTYTGLNPEDVEARLTTPYKKVLTTLVDNIEHIESTLLFRSEGLSVAVVRNGRAKLVPVTIGHDYGSTVEVISSLTADDAVIIDPSDSILDGSPVQVAQPTQKESAR